MKKVLHDNHHNLLSDGLGQRALEAVDRDVSDQSVHLFLSLLVVVTLASETNADAEGNVLDALRPQVLVQLRVNTHIGRAHLLLSKLLHLNNSAGSAALETTEGKGVKKPSHR